MSYRKTGINLLSSFFPIFSKGLEVILMGISLVNPTQNSKLGESNVKSSIIYKNKTTK